MLLKTRQSLRGSTPSDVHCTLYLQVSTVDCSPMEAWRAASGGADRCIKVWDLRNGYCVASSPYHSACSTLRFMVEGTQIVSGHMDGTLRFYDIRLGKVVHELTGLHNGPITSVSVAHLGGGLPDLALS